MTFEWTPAGEASLRDLWAEGLTTREIGDRIGCGKNAVIGKARRLGLTARQSPIKNPDYVLTRAKPRREKPARVDYTPRPSAPPRIRYGGGRMQDPSRKIEGRSEAFAPPQRLPNCAPVIHRECQWPNGDPREPGFSFCCAPVTRWSYCAEHNARAWVKL